MHAATASEWLTAAAIGAGGFVPGALAILALDHDLTPRRPHVDLGPARAAVADTVQRARLALAAWLLVLAWDLEQPKGAR